MKVVIIGGVAGGATAAARIRRLDESAEIVIFEKSGFISYANCGLPYYIGGTIPQASSLTLQTPQSFAARFHVAVHINHEVTAIHPAEQCVTVKNLQTGKERAESYDKLLIATGAKPLRPALPGINSERLFSLRTVEDTLRIRQYVENTKPCSAVIVGGGFIGVEMAENLRELGLDVTVLQSGDQLMPIFDRDMAAWLHTEMRQNGVNLVLNARVNSFLTDDHSIHTRLPDGRTFSSDFVILAIGVHPDTHLAKAAGLALGLKESILVNERMEASVPNIYAVGDAVQVNHTVTNAAALIALAGPANKQGRIAADNICGRNSRYWGSQGSSILKVFRLTAAATGINQKTAQALGMKTEKVILSPMSHAGYYPGGKVMTMQVLFEPETDRLLGAQIIGYDGVDKRIDVLATAIHAGMQASKLAELDLAYAPPYASAKDPVNIAGFMIENLETGLIRQWYAEDADTLPRDGSAELIDTRTPGEYAAGHLEGFVNIPVDNLRECIGEIATDKPVYLVCQSGVRSYIAARILEGYGITASHLAGGYRHYSALCTDRALTKSTTACGMDA